MLTQSADNSVMIQNRNSIPIVSIDELDSNNVLVNERFKQILLTGFFYLKIPDESYNEIKTLKLFIETFGKRDEVKNEKGLLEAGYINQKKSQAESFLAERGDWNYLEEKQIYPVGVANLANVMANLGSKILVKALNVLNIPRSKWSKLTGKLSDNKGWYILNCNNFKANKSGIGLGPHKDFGYVTLVYNEKEGLEAKIKGEWVPIPPKEGHFIVNFGDLFERAINDTTKLVAIEHQVVHQNQNRISAVLFLDGAMDEPVYKYNKETKKAEEIYSTHKEYLQAMVEGLWGDGDF
ncbi:MAG: hypothetical protein S4CHLAM6_13720 [Chlamydiae bacterium]|nr:hypothetical protein [Chlamydiota bacterium]